jgi:ATP-dependent DNA helicase RecQ
MGIDKPNVRFVVHHDVSESLDAYYQEVGRAGRDGEPARAILFFSERDLNLHRFFAGGGKLRESEVRRVIGVLAAATAPLEVKAIATHAELTVAKVSRSLTRLEDQGLVEREASGEASLIGRVRDFSRHVSSAVSAQAAFGEANRQRIEEIRAYARSRDCRRAVLLSHFGEELGAPCSGCDNCDLRAS